MKDYMPVSSLLLAAAALVSTVQGEDAMNLKDTNFHDLLRAPYQAAPVIIATTASPVSASTIAQALHTSATSTVAVNPSTKPPANPASNNPTDSTGDGSTSPAKYKSPTYEQFCEGVNGYAKTTAGGIPPKPTREVYDAYLKNVASKIDILEQAMFVANSCWETGGLQFLEELACKDTPQNCHYSPYYGRGYIQLTWDYNYRDASKAIYGDERVLLDNPDLVALPDGAWATAMWFWMNKVHPVVVERQADSKYLLGYTVKVINGGLECPANEKANNRLAIYNFILSAWGIDPSNPGNVTEGC